ncbi:protein ANTAGONIST OF LIKE HETEROCHROMATIN PROTEIN 1-like [Xenia sp. Carnegie-2017]|uniref:protein ANTAGONIST OF LIKE HETEROCHROMATIN PROTEIN 1-like n=1 Tax=Xenia sp. Carnegie-2017 TaxID=2897299 RepID=UPI001F0389A1|nr:protein ANTAGONIST OF LIKE HETEROCHROMATIN PROTEIN 1-like [Xenia sp. Carnegie-2017]
MADEVIATIFNITSEYHKKMRMRRVRRKKYFLKLRKQRSKRRDGLFYFWFIGALGNKLMSERRFWVDASKGTGLFLEKSIDMWKDDGLWLENFRMSKGTFDFICNKINDTLLREDTNFRKAIPVPKRVGICLWHLATNEDLRSLAWRFSIGKSTACEIVNEVCQAIFDVLLRLVIKWPTGDRLQSIVDAFLTTCGVPQCAGAIDGTHIQIVAPSNSAQDYYNRKGFYSIVLQAVVDHQYRFTDICIKWPGRVHDARVLSNSGVFAKAEAGKLFQDGGKEICGCNVPFMLFGDPAYPLLPWLMKRHPNDGNLCPAQKKFNYYISRARQVVECAFGRLKNRFRCLLNKNYTNLDHLPMKIAACSVVHNICESRADKLFADYVELIPDDEISEFVLQNTDASAEQIRNSLTEFLITQ